MRKVFFTGLIILLPLTITIIIIRFFLNLVTGPFEKLTHSFLTQFSFFQNGSNQPLMHIISIVLIILAGVLALSLIGFITRIFASRSFIHMGDRILRKIPLVKGIYTACKDFTDGLFSPKSGSFTQVVLFPFPSKGKIGIGLVTSEFSSNIEGEEKMYASVLIPGTPNPMTGFLLVLPKTSLTYLSISVDEALKYMMSCGAYMPEHFLEKQVVLPE